MVEGLGLRDCGLKFGFRVWSLGSKPSEGGSEGVFPGEAGEVDFSSEVDFSAEVDFSGEADASTFGGGSWNG